MTALSPLAGRALAVAALAAAAALLSACGNSAPSGSPGATVTVTTTPTTATTAPASPTPSASTSVNTGPISCPTDDLKVTAGLSQGAAGSTYQIIDFTNISSTVCTLYGYPGVSFAGGTPVAQIGVAADEDPSTPRVLVTLSPGAVANAQLRIVEAGNFPAGKCHLTNTSYLQIYPPNQTTPVLLAYSSQACAGQVHTLTIGTVHAGSGG